MFFSHLQVIVIVWLMGGVSLLGLGLRRRLKGPGAGVGVLGEEQPAPSPSARGSEERCKLFSGVWGGAPSEIEFGAF